MPRLTAPALAARLLLCALLLGCFLLTACGESAHVSPRGEIVVGGSIGGHD